MTMAKLKIKNMLQFRINTTIDGKKRYTRVRV